MMQDNLERLRAIGEERARADAAGLEALTLLSTQPLEEIDAPLERVIEVESAFEELAPEGAELTAATSVTENVAVMDDDAILADIVKETGSRDAFTTKGAVSEAKDTMISTAPDDFEIDELVLLDQVLADLAQKLQEADAHDSADIPEDDLARTPGNLGEATHSAPVPSPMNPAIAQVIRATVEKNNERLEERRAIGRAKRRVQLQPEDRARYAERVRLETGKTVRHYDREARDRRFEAGLTPEQIRAEVKKASYERSREGLRRNAKPSAMTDEERAEHVKAQARARKERWRAKHKPAAKTNITTTTTTTPESNE